jgi:Raf kinase inhibitor-like YbhB/YbcL family protein
MDITSSSFRHMKAMASRFAHRDVTGGENLSPALAWRDTPSESRSLALIAVDIHPVAGRWIHWLIVNIPPTAGSISEGASSRRLPPGAIELYNSFSDIGYGGPMPPRGSGLHTYVFTLYALDVAALDISLHASLTTFSRAIEGHVLASASTSGLFER